MAYIDMSNKPMFIMTKNGLKEIKIIKREYNKNLGCYIIREYEEVKKEK